MIKLILALTAALMPSLAAAQSLSADRANAMLPFMAQDRDRAMNDHALCSADLMLAKQRIADLEKQLAAKADADKPAAK